MCRFRCLYVCGRPALADSWQERLSGVVDVQAEARRVGGGAATPSRDGRGAATASALKVAPGGIRSGCRWRIQWHRIRSGLAATVNATLTRSS